MGESRRNSFRRREKCCCTLHKNGFRTSAYKNLSMLILDEPTHNLDANSVSKLSEMLREEMPKLVEQIFIITHDKQLEEAASSNLYLLTGIKILMRQQKQKQKFI